jgi:hypothetical protein
MKLTSTSRINLAGTHLLDAVEFLLPRHILPAGEGPLTLQSLVAVHEPCLQLPALCAEPGLQATDVRVGILNKSSCALPAEGFTRCSCQRALSNNERT